MPSADDQDTESGREAPSAGPGPDADEMRRQFQEALSRKTGQHHGGNAGGSSGGPAVPHVGSGPAKAQRTFRRKSG